MQVDYFFSAVSTHIIIINISFNGICIYETYTDNSMFPYCWIFYSVNQIDIVFLPLFLATQSKFMGHAVNLVLTCQCKIFCIARVDYEFTI